MDLYTISKIRTLSKQRRRERREKMDAKFAEKTFEEQMKEQAEKDEKEQQQKKINALFETIKALQIIGADTTDARNQLKEALQIRYR